jgi:hypothetical protein
MMALGQRIADSARTAAGDVSPPSPHVPDGLQDREMMALLGVRSGRGDGAGAPGLESVSLLHDAKPRRDNAPEAVLLETEAWSSLVTLAHGGFAGRLARGALPVPHAGLIRAGLATQGGLNDAGRALGSLSGHAPALTIHGRRLDQEWRGEIRLDGMECLLTLDPGPGQSSPAPGARVARQSSTIGLAGVLLDWCGLRADWFADLRASAAADRADAPARRAGRADGWTVDSGDAVMKGILEDPSTLWTIALPGGEVQVSWIQPDLRGPLMVFGGEDGQRVQLVSTTGLALHETLSTLVRDVARLHAGSLTP